MEQLPGDGARRSERHLPVTLPRGELRPARAVARRVVVALLVLFGMAGIVYLDRDGYRDNVDETVSLLDAVYYATVSLSTTGYGDITPVTPESRLVNILAVTPLRVLFVIILVGTTVEALTERSRAEWRIDRWRRKLRDHVVVVGYGTKGRSAAKHLLAQGTPKERIVVVDPTAQAIGDANNDGLAGIVGDATRSEILQRAEVHRAKKVIVAAHRDDTAVLVTLTARSLNPKATIVSAVRESENAPLLQQSGADAVITSSDAAGRLLGVACTSPTVGEVMEDLLIQSSGLALCERVLHTAEVGRPVSEVADMVVAVVRGGRVRLYNDPDLGVLRQDDRLVVVQADGQHVTGERLDQHRT